jgi:hypothetical protein
VSEEDYSVERQLLATRVFPTGQGRLDPAPHTQASVVDPRDVYRRWRSSQGSDLDDAVVEVVFGLFTDEVQGRPGPLSFDRRPAWVVFDSYTSLGRPGHSSVSAKLRGEFNMRLRYRIEKASVYDARTGEYLTGCLSATPLA